nr:RNA-dependent RNA polymerase [Umbelopsis ramanniana virus 5]
MEDIVKYCKYYDGALTAGLINGLYEPGPASYSFMTKVNVRTILELGWHQENPLIQEAMRYQTGQLDYAVAALCIWLWTPTASYVCADLPIHKLPLDKWPLHVKEFASECRRLGQIFGRGKDEVAHAFRLRKLIALCGRTSDEADWDVELSERVTDTTPKLACSGGIVSTDAYRRIRQHTLSAIAEAAVQQLQRRGGSFKEYWEQRWLSTPRGTTSKAGEAKRNLKNVDAKLDLQMRPIKPTIMELTDAEALKRQLRGDCFAVARGSTKPEPGLKRRALLAVDDRTALIAGYASSGVEVATKLGGMVLRQDPADVAEWLAFDAGPHVWRVSNDYSNFNILHSLRSLQEVDLSFARAWDKVSEPWAKSKAAAERWIAQSYNNAVMHTPGGSARARCGLWSGHRNTARDNTFLHLAYLRCVQSIQLQLFGRYADCTKQRICGDDETVAFANWAPAVTHAIIADAAGFTSQKSKGMLSRHHDEFLQLIRLIGNVPQYPVAHTMLTFCSGNWYKSTVRNLSTVIKDVSDHVWQMVMGGLPVKRAQQLAAKVLDYLMQSKVNGELVKREWFAYRGCGLPDGHPLWGFVPTEKPPLIKARAAVLSAPGNATDDAMRTEQQAWDLLDDPAFKAEVRKQRKWDSYQNIAKHYLQEQYDLEADKVWPMRESVVTFSDVVRRDAPPSRWRAFGARGKGFTARHAAIKHNIPPEMLSHKGLPKVLAALPARDRARFIFEREEPTQHTEKWKAFLPPLLQAL